MQKFFCPENLVCRFPPDLAHFDFEVFAQVSSQSQRSIEGFNKRRSAFGRRWTEIPDSTLLATNGKFYSPICRLTLEWTPPSTPANATTFASRPAQPLHEHPVNDFIETYARAGRRAVRLNHRAL